MIVDMTIQAVVFDIGGILEITPDRGWARDWDAALGLTPGELGRRMSDVWRGGEIGTVTEAEVHQAARERLGLDQGQLDRFMGDLWRDYLGTGNTELIEYARGLRPRYRTGILSNSFVGAREREQAAYGFEDLVDELVYSHECGLRKPDPRSYALVCARLGVEPARTVFLDDYEPNVEGARRAGLQAVLYRSNAQAIGDIEELLGRNSTA
jgi:epoxide hydrolase-like predicted phosphatase